MKLALSFACSSLLVLFALLSLRATPQADTGPVFQAQAQAKACYVMKTEECNDCPGKNSFFCDPKKTGAFTSCTPLDASEDCRGGFCAEIDLGPTGGHCNG